jgi:hypothetical protein
MITQPYRTLMHYKRWATNGLNSVLAEKLESLSAEEQVLVLRLLDHIQAVDEIFSHNLEARPHGYRAPRSAELPSFEAVVGKARAMGTGTPTMSTPSRRKPWNRRSPSPSRTANPRI